MQVVDHVGALAVLLDTGKAHRGAGDEAFRIGDELVEVVVAPGAALTAHPGGFRSAEWLPQVDKFKNYIINAEIGIESDLRTDKKLSLRTYLQDTYNSVPATGRKKNDVKLVAAIAYKF